MVNLLPNPKKIEFTDGVLKTNGQLPTLVSNGGGAENNNPDYYSLEINEHGVFYSGSLSAATQTLRQLQLSLPNENELPCLKIEDWGEFGYRGVLLDVSRHFRPASDVIKFIKTISLFKINKLQLHATDDHGWRLPITKYPKLTEIGSRMGSSGLLVEAEHMDYHYNNDGFYTKEDIKNIVETGQEYGVQVIPEIDLPGHSLAAIAAYPELGISYLENKDFQVVPQTEMVLEAEVLNMMPATLEFYKDIFDEVVADFQTDMVAIGGDECPKDKLKQSPTIAKYMADLQISDYDDLQNYFMEQVVNHLYSKGVKTLCWDEVIDAARPIDQDKIIVEVWRDFKNNDKALKKGYQIMCCPYRPWYLDLSQQENDPYMHHGLINTLADVYGFVPPENAIGGQGNIWTEMLNTLADVEDAAFPRLLAIAEVLWNGENKPDFATFVETLKTKYDLFKKLDVNTRKV